MKKFVKGMRVQFRATGAKGTVTQVFDCFNGRQGCTVVYDSGMVAMYYAHGFSIQQLSAI